MEEKPIVAPAGMRERRFRESDLDLAHGLVNAYDAAMGGIKLPLEDLRRFTRTTGFSWEDNVFGLVDGDLLVGFGMIWNNDPGSIPDFGFGVTRPGYTGRGIGTYLLERLERRHREIRRAHPEGPGQLRVHVDLVDVAAVRLHETRGYAEVRRNYTMAVTLGRYEEPEPLAGFDVGSIEEHDLPVFHDVLEESFSEHWGNVPETFKEFMSGSVDRPDTRFDLWLLALSGNDPAGVMLGRVKDDIGWIEALGIRKPYRGRGVGRHLLLRALWLFQREGQKEARLGVDTQNASGAVALYESVGMQAVAVSATFEKV